MKACLYALMLIAPLAWSEPAPDDSDLLREEVRSAESRERAELEDRVQDLEAQQRASKAIAERQQQLIDALEKQIQALQKEKHERTD